MDWMVLDWNTPAIDFYRRLGADVLTEWELCRLAGDALTALAQQCAGKRLDRLTDVAPGAVHFPRRSRRSSAFIQRSIFCARRSRGSAPSESNSS